MKKRHKISVSLTEVHVLSYRLIANIDMYRSILSLQWFSVLKNNISHHYQPSLPHDSSCSSDFMQRKVLARRVSSHSVYLTTHPYQSVSCHICIVTWNRSMEFEQQLILGMVVAPAVVEDGGISVVVEVTVVGASSKQAQI